jgi:hypothetical protein
LPLAWVEYGKEKRKGYKLLPSNELSQEVVKRAIFFFPVEVWEQMCNMTYNLISINERWSLHVQKHKVVVYIKVETSNYV